ncbi:hypothetical protein ACFXTH_001325 [Malus domestica]
MSGGIRTSVKGYINAKRVTLTLEPTDENKENEIITRHLRSETLLDAAAGCLDKKPAEVPHDLPWLSSAASNFELECVETPHKWIGGMDPALLDDIIRRFFNLSAARPYLNLVTESEMMQLCHCSTEIMLGQPNILDLKSPISIIGEKFTERLSTQVKDWEFTITEASSSANYLAYVFLGDFMEFAEGSICLLLAYKVKYPNNVFLLRGDDECATNQRYATSFRSELWEVFNDCFNCIPVAAIVDGRFIPKPTIDEARFPSHSPLYF